MRSLSGRILLICFIGAVVFSVAHLVLRNIFVVASVEQAAAEAVTDSLRRTKQALVSRIAELESPRRLREIGRSLGLSPLPLDHFILLEADE